MEYNGKICKCSSYAIFPVKVNKDTTVIFWLSETLFKKTIVEIDW